MARPTDDPVPVTIALGDASGVYPPVEWRGKTYRLGHPTQAVKARYEDAVVEAERRAIDAQLARGWITPEKHDEKLDRLGRRVERGDHRTGGPLWLRYAVGEDAPTGVLVFFLCLFQERHPDLALADVEAMAAEVPALLRLAVRRVVPDFFAWVGAALRLPPDRQAELDAAVAAQVARLAPDPATPSGSTPRPST